MTKYDKYATIWIIFCILTIGFMSAAIIVSAEDQNITQMKYFLLNDTTNQHEYLQWYTCGHFSRDLVKNATNHNITIGSVILGNHPVFRGHNNHIMNYFTENQSIWIIEPQTDEVMRLNDTMYNYYRLYPDGTQVPSYWRYNLAYTGIIS